MKSSTFFGIAIGAGCGFLAGLMLAPRTGGETRALLVDRVDELWGQGQDFYERNVKDLGSRAKDAVPVAAAKGDELREKIEIARERIASQVARNAADMRDAVNPGSTQVASETVVEGAADEVAAAPEAAAAPGQPAPAGAAAE